MFSSPGLKPGATKIPPLWGFVSTIIYEEPNKITTARLAKILGVSRMTIARDIESLKQKNIIQRIGSPKGGHWKVI